MDFKNIPIFQKKVQKSKSNQNLKKKQKCTNNLKENRHAKEINLRNHRKIQKYQNRKYLGETRIPKSTNISKNVQNIKK